MDNYHDTEAEQMRGYEKSLGTVGGKANDVQHGGDHYKGANYQHWDWVNDIGLDYHDGTATKYIFRYTKKGGSIDLEKAVHYFDKADELRKDAPVLAIDADRAMYISTRTLALGVAHNLSAKQVHALTQAAFGGRQSAREATTQLLVEQQELEKAQPLS